MHISQQLSYQGLMTIVTWTLVQKKVHACTCADRGMKIFIVKYVLIVLFFLLLAFEQIITSGSSRKKNVRDHASFIKEVVFKKLILQYILHSALDKFSIYEQTCHI